MWLVLHAWLHKKTLNICYGTSMDFFYVMWLEKKAIFVNSINFYFVEEKTHLYNVYSIMIESKNISLSPRLYFVNTVLIYR